MNTRHSLFIGCLGSLIVAINISSCSKSSPDPSNPPPTDACAGKTIVVTATPTAASGCGGTGSITVTASGSSGFTYKLNSGGSYQASGSFTAVDPGSYTVFAMDAAGCEGSQAVTVALTSGTLGAKFTAVKNLLTAKCVTCHNSTNTQGGMNWTVDCNIVQFKDRIKARAVDIGDMPFGGPTLTAGEKAVITDWITAGGQLNN
jgi:hypothetical protein